MKEFKFWALLYTPFQLLLIFLPVGIIFLFLFVYVDGFLCFEYFVAGVFGWIIIFFLFFVKRVRINFSESGIIRLYINGQEKMVAEPRHFEYARGIDENSLLRGWSPLYLVFNGKEFVFNILNTHDLGGDNKQRQLLRYMIDTYNLKKVIYKKFLIGAEYTYYNPAFKGVSITNYNKKEK